jgi:fructoselysine-6-P-deglycase FrlB-like protein
MRQARDKLDEAKRREARSEQEKAIEELETARAELEEILRQMREEEVERLLVQLGARIRLTASGSSRRHVSAASRRRSATTPRGR